MFNSQAILSFIDLTSLNDNDNETAIERLCQQARTPLGNVAAVCVYPQFVALAADLLQNSSIRVATVSNFPHGTQSLSQTLDEIAQAIEDGAHEIDVVMPYTAYLLGEIQYVQRFIAACKSSCDQKAALKVILETGVLKDKGIIAAACQDAIDAGADFIKTSTGKCPVGATPRAAEIMLKVIHATEYEVGFKAAGGIQTIEQAQTYLQLASQIMGQDWLSPAVFRIGTSRLLQALLDHDLTEERLSPLPA
jgi:deoxyribose-phosphate aldolase